MFGITILGNNSALPAHGRHPTAQVITFSDQVFLIDCGEGTQMQLSAYKVKRSRINHIFISHMHGDHYFGLPGLITSMGLLGREMPLHLYAPPELLPILNLQFEAANTTLPFTLHFHAIQSAGNLVEEKKFKVACFPVKHRIPCWGFLFTEKKQPRKLVIEAVIAAGIPTAFYPQLQMGENYTNKNGRVVENETVTVPATPGRSYAFCADTIFDPDLCTVVKGVNLLYHEATYLHDLEERAKARFHTTAFQAGSIAKAADVQRLIIGHFSSKYDHLDDFETEARTAFPSTDLAIEGVTYLVK